MTNLHTLPFLVEIEEEFNDHLGFHFQNPQPNQSYLYPVSCFTIMIEVDDTPRHLCPDLDLDCESTNGPHVTFAHPMKTSWR